MQIYAKFINNEKIEIAPLNKGSMLNYNINEELMIKDGYKPLIKTVLPNSQRDYVITYCESEKNIQEIITYTESEEDYQAKLKNAENISRTVNLRNQINELDIKRIRAMCEPSIKDESTGEYWLDFYNSEIAKLREQLKELE